MYKAISFILAAITVSVSATGAQIQEEIDQEAFDIVDAKDFDEGEDDFTQIIDNESDESGNEDNEFMQMMSYGEDEMP